MSELESLLHVDGPHRRMFLAGEPHVFHCHHYNVFLQQSIRDAEYIDSDPFLVGGANEVAYAQLPVLFERLSAATVEARREVVRELYRWLGMGRIDVSEVSSSGGVVRADSSHYGEAHLARFGRSDRPADPFTAGWLSGALAAVFDAPPDTFDVVQRACPSMGAAGSIFELTTTSQPSYTVFSSPGAGPLTDHAPRPVPPGPIDAEAIGEAVSGMRFSTDARGFIPAFGVWLTRHYANYYNRISFELLHALRSAFGDDGIEVARAVLVEAGHVCAFNTLGGIMLSTEWDALIRPIVRNAEDRVQGIVAVTSALGWGRWQVTEVDEREATFVVHDDYESVGYLGAFGRSEAPVAYLAEGAAKGILNLVYLGRIDARPTLDEAFYDRLFRGPDAYVAEWQECRSMGDPVSAIRIFKP